MPCTPIGHADNKVISGQPQTFQGMDCQGNEFGIGRLALFTDDISVKLEMFPQTPTLLSFVAKQLGNGEPFDGFLEIAMTGRHHACQRWCHFRSQCYRALALVHKVIKLTDDFLTGFLGIQIERLQGRTIIFLKSVTTRRLTPAVEDELTHSHAVGIKITKTGKRLHQGSLGEKSALGHTCTAKKDAENAWPKEMVDVPSLPSTPGLFGASPCPA